MCRKSVQTAVGKLHFAANMAGEEDPRWPISTCLVSDEDRFYRLLTSAAGPWGM